MHNEAFGRSTGFEKFAQLNLNNAKPFGLELLAQFPADRVKKNRVADIDGIAREAKGIGFRDNNPFRRRVEGFNCCDRGRIEGIRVVKDVAVGKRREAGIEVIETRVDKMKRDHFDSPCPAQLVVAGRCGARTMASPQTRAIAGEKRITFTLEWRATRDLENTITGVLKPTTEVPLFSLTLGVEEAAEGDDAIALETGIGSKNHVG